MVIWRKWKKFARCGNPLPAAGCVAPVGIVQRFKSQEAPAVRVGGVWVHAAREPTAWLLDRERTKNMEM